MAFLNIDHLFYFNANKKSRAFNKRVLRSSLFVVSSRTTNHVIHIPSMQWINTLILCCWNARPLTYYCIIKRLRSETGHAKAGSYHTKPRNGGGKKEKINFVEQMCHFLWRLHVTLEGEEIHTQSQNKGKCFDSDVQDPLEGGKAGTAGGWVRRGRVCVCRCW